ncbi:MAG: hypothetical protein HY537_06470 [Deltaproteobacteria bacterium]|nr:hypothetical protein [Deltaproteobacteria bacterium]
MTMSCVQHLIYLLIIIALYPCLSVGEPFELLEPAKNWGTPIIKAKRKFSTSRQPQHVRGEGITGHKHGNMGQVQAMEHEHVNKGKYGFGVLLFQNVSLSGQDSAVPANMQPMSGMNSSMAPVSEPAEDPDVHGMPESSTIINARGGYELSEISSVYLNLGGNIQKGMLDPALGLAVRFPMDATAMWMLSVQATLPLSKYSRENSRLTTVSATTGPMVDSRKFIVGIVGTLAYSIFQRQEHETSQINPTTPSTTPSPPSHQHLTGSGAAARASSHDSMPGMHAPDELHASANLSAGYHLSRSVTALTGASIGLGRSIDGSTSYMTGLNVARIGYGTGSLSLSAGFSLVSDHMRSEGALTVPTLPFVGLGVGFALGNGRTLGDMAVGGGHH